MVRIAQRFNPGSVFHDSTEVQQLASKPPILPARSTCQPRCPVGANWGLYLWITDGIERRARFFQTTPSAQNPNAILRRTTTDTRWFVYFCAFRDIQHELARLPFPFQRPFEPSHH